MEIAFRVARRELIHGSSAEEASRCAKIAASFAGSMRPNLIANVRRTAGGAMPKHSVHRRLVRIESLVSAHHLSLPLPCFQAATELHRTEPLSSRINFVNELCARLLS